MMAINSGATSHKKVDWKAIDWQQANRNVTRLQARIVKATQACRWNQVETLQHLLTHSFSAKALARNSLTVFMYVLAEHRVQKPMSFGYTDVSYADWLEPADLESDSPLHVFVPRRLFLTKIVEYIYEPQAINYDYVFEFAATDDTYHAVRYNYISDFIGIPLCLLIPGTIILLIVVALVLALRGRVRHKHSSQVEPMEFGDK